VADTGQTALGNRISPESEQALAEGRIVASRPSETEGGTNRLGRALAVPIRLQNQVIGVMDFLDEGEAQAWTDDDLAMVQAVSDQLALALENAQLFSETRESLNKQALA